MPKREGALVAAKIALIGLCATFVRILGQLLIPAGEQTVLAPSVFVRSGIMPLAFAVYGWLAYSLIAALFLLLRGRMTGARAAQGLRYGLSCCAVWVAYLLEPLPHVAPLDRLTYPLADSAALLAMGALCGLLLAKDSPSQPAARRVRWRALLVRTGCFTAGRMAQYWLLHTYSSFAQQPMETLLWCVLTGAVVAAVTLWLERFVRASGRLARAAVVGLLLFGLDLTLFNFFMPLVFDADLPDLLLRTAVDTLAVSAGCLLARE